MPDFVSFFVVLLAGIVFSELFRRLHLPWVVALILGGVIVGPSMFGIFEINETLDFIGQIGLIFLMFMAGLETKLSSLKEHRHSIALVSLINGAIPFLAGVSIALAFGYGITASLLLGIIFISSSIAVVIPSLESNGFLHTKTGSLIVASTMVQDLASLLLLSIVFQSFGVGGNIPLGILYPSLFLLFVMVRWLLPKLKLLFTRTISQARDIFERDIRIVFTSLIGVVIALELLGLHPIIAGFFAGLMLSGYLRSEILMDKLRTLSYGLFIPVFFIVIGASIDIKVLNGLDSSLWLALTIIVGSVLSKYLSGILGGYAAGLRAVESKLVAVSSIPQLSTTLAVTFIGFDLGILDQTLITAMVLLSVVTTFIGPILIHGLRKRTEDKGYAIY